MSSVTAQVLVGGRGNFDDGIRPAYAVFLNENDRPALLLRSIDPYRDERQEDSDVVWVWIPTVEHTLQDAILMIAVYVLKNEEILLLFQDQHRIRNLIKKLLQIMRKKFYFVMRALVNGR